MSRDDLVSEIAQILEPWAWETKSYNATVARDDATSKAMQIVDLLANRPADDGERWRHVKRGTEYTMLGTGELQDAAGQGLHEGHMLVIYRGDDGQLWARHPNEFYDGRFVEIAPQPEGVKRS